MYHNISLDLNWLLCDSGKRSVVISEAIVVVAILKFIEMPQIFNAL